MQIVKCKKCGCVMFHICCENVWICPFCEGKVDHPITEEEYKKWIEEQDRIAKEVWG